MKAPEDFLLLLSLRKASSAAKVPRIGLVAAIGIGSSTETTHSALHDLLSKVFERVQFLTADSGPGIFSMGNVPHQSRSFGTAVLSLHKQGKEDV